MCFYVHKDHSKAKIAKEDIIVFKSIYENNEAIFYDYQYEVGIKNPRVKLKTHKTIYDNIVIYEGYHSYDLQQKTGYNGDPRVIERREKKEVNFIIPKGTKYYFNPDHLEYVSETIIMQDNIS